MVEDPMDWVHNAIRLKRVNKLLDAMHESTDSIGVYVRVTPEELIELMPEIAEMVLDLRRRKLTSANEAAA